MLGFLSQTTVVDNSEQQKTRADTSERRARAWLESRLARGRKERFTEFAQLTPHVAEIILSEHNHGNRTCTTATVRSYAAMMQRGEWLLTDKGVAFSREGVLNDGQHRCKAVIEAGVAVPVTFTFGCDRQEFTVVDQGKARTAAHLLGMEGFSQPTTVAALGASLYMIEQNTQAVPAARRIMEYVLSLPRSPVEDASIAGYRAHKRTSPTSGALAYYLIGRDSKRSVMLPQFWDDFVTGAMLPRRSPILALHEHLKDPKSTGANGGRGTNIKRAAAIILAWNTWSRGARRGSLAWSHTLSLPEVM